MTTPERAGIAARLFLWDLVQRILGAPDFKRRLYASVLGPPGKLLDFGCADGHIADAFMEFDYYGLDLDASAIRFAERRFKAYPNAHFMAGDVLAKPFPEGFFDEILFAGTLHHLDDSAAAGILVELNRCLKSGGRIHLLDPVLQAKDGWQQKLMRRIDRGRHPRTPGQVRQLVDSIGLFEIGEASLHAPHGALLQDCEFLHLPLTKNSVPGGHPKGEERQEPAGYDQGPARNTRTGA